MHSTRKTNQICFENSFSNFGRFIEIKWIRVMCILKLVITISSRKSKKPNCSAFEKCFVLKSFKKVFMNQRE